jgi:molybdenum cofactor sulfurtransferase
MDDLATALDAYKKQIDNLRNLKENESESEFEHLRNEIYLDHAANAIYMQSLIKDYYHKLAKSNYSSMNFLFSNPHSKHQSGLYTNFLVEQTRNKILKLFNTVDSEYDVVFVSNATQGINNLQLELVKAKYS